MYVDLGSRRGQSVQQFLRAASAAHRYIVHAFEPNPAHLPALRAFAQRSPAAARITVHPEAAWTTATQARQTFFSRIWSCVRSPQQHHAGLCSLRQPHTTSSFSVSVGSQVHHRILHVVALLLFTTLSDTVRRTCYHASPVSRMVTVSRQVRMSTSEAGVASDHRGRRKQPGLLKQVVAAWRRRRFGEPGHSSGSMFVPPRHASANVSVQAVDFSEWLLRNVRPQDHLVLHIDIAGAEFEVCACPVLGPAQL